MRYTLHAIAIASLALAAPLQAEAPTGNDKPLSAPSVSVGPGYYAILPDKLLLSSVVTGGGGGIYLNPFDAHFTVQIVGNLGYTAGVAEMLLHSHSGEIVLLPALPQAWPTGSVTGLCARGGFPVDISWQGDRLTGTTIRSDRGGACNVRWSGKAIELKAKRGKTYRLEGEPIDHVSV